jgi:group I intron endonuclease
MSIIYKTTNLVTGKIYVGKAKINDPSYLGSGVILNQSIKKHGKQNFVKELLEECDDSIVDSREKHWISILKSTDRNIGYNITDGGSGGDTTSNNPEKENIAKKRSIGVKNWHDTLTEDEKRIRGANISVSKTGKSNGREGHTQSEQTKKLIRENQPEKTDDWRKSHAEAMSKRKGTSLTKKYKQVIVDGVEYESVKHAVAGLGLKYAKYFHDMRRTGKIKVEYK